MIRSRISCQFRTACNLRFVQTRRFHASPSSKLSFAGIPLPPSIIVDSLSHGPTGLLCLLGLSLHAAFPNVVRIWVERFNIRGRLRYNVLKPLQLALARLDDQMPADGKERVGLKRSYTNSLFWSPYGHMVVSVRNVLPFTSHVLFTAYALMYLREGSDLYQSYVQTNMASLIALIPHGEASENVLGKVGEYLQTLEPATASFFTPTLGLFLMYQYYRMFLDSQFWKGWDLNAANNILRMPLPMKNIFTHSIEHGHAYMVPEMLVSLRKWNLKRIQVEIILWFRMRKVDLDMFFHYRDTKHLYRILQELMLFSVVLWGIPLFVLIMPMVLNPAQMLYLAVSTVFARLRARAARRYENKMTIKQNRENKTWERIEPVKQPRHMR